MRDLENALKTKMGEDYPKGMIFLKKKGKIHFYNKDIDRGESIFEGSERQAILELDAFVLRINQLYSSSV